MSLPVDGLAIHPEIIKKLKNAKISKLEDVLVKGSADLQKATQISAAKIENIKEQACNLLYPIKVISAWDCLKSAYQKLPTGCDSIDRALNGGILCQGITEISGESACGKTQICMQLALHSQLVKRNGRLSNCLYICTEDVFPSQRLLQLEQSIKHHNPLLTNHRFSDHVFVEHISNKDQLLAALENKVPKLLARGLTNLIIIDSITAVFRGQDEQQTISARSKDISAIGVQLHRLATEYHVAVLCVNQVMADMTGSGESRNLPALGLTWSNLVTTRLKVRRSHQDSIRQLVVAFAPHLHNNYCEYLITEHGVVSPG